MALYPGAVHRLIRPGSNDPAITVIGAILHVDASNAESLYNYFNGPSQGIESHFHVPKAGRPEQYRDTGFEADANYKANSFYRGDKRYGFVSIETQGYGQGPWNEHQLAEIKALLLWLSQTHGFPLRVAPGPFEAGVGFHTLYPEWSPVAKSCPGPDRKHQFYNVLVPWMSNPQEDDMTPAESQMLKEVHGRLFGVTDQRYHEDGSAVRLLDQLDGNYLVKQIVASRLDPKVVAQEVVALLPDNIDAAAVEGALESYFAKKFGASE